MGVVHVADRNRSSSILMKRVGKATERNWIIGAKGCAFRLSSHPEKEPDYCYRHMFFLISFAHETIHAIKKKNTPLFDA